MTHMHIKSYFLKHGEHKYKQEMKKMMTNTQRRQELLIWTDIESLPLTQQSIKKIIYLEPCQLEGAFRKCTAVF